MNFDELKIFFVYYLLAKFTYNVLKIGTTLLLNKFLVFFITRQIQNGSLKVVAPTEFDMIDSRERGH